MTPVGFEPTISEGERPQTYALDRAATGTGLTLMQHNFRSEYYFSFYNGIFSHSEDNTFSMAAFL